MVLHRVGIIGGAFDPITSGHLTICLEAINSKQIDTVWDIPCGTRPDKPKLKTSAQVHDVRACGFNAATRRSGQGIRLRPFESELCLRTLVEAED